MAAGHLHDLHVEERDEGVFVERPVWQVHDGGERTGDAPRQPQGRGRHPVSSLLLLLLLLLLLRRGLALHLLSCPGLGGFILNATTKRSRWPLRKRGDSSEETN